jgi:tRNA(fMet)-specific endonuclease VapC
VAVLIDTSVLIAAERGRLSLAVVLDRTEQYAISVVTAAELLHGVHRADPPRAAARAARIDGFLEELPTLPIDMRVARSFARTSATLAAAGTPVDSNDLWIASTALAYDLELMALDGDYDRIPGLRRASFPGIPHPR